MLRVRLLASLLAAVAVLLLAAAGSAMAVDPSPVPSPVLLDPLDPRAGAGANLVGAPMLALVVILGVGVAAAVVGFAWARLAHR